MKPLLFSMVAMTMMTGGLSAQSIACRRQSQQARIAQGIYSGQLTARETSRLEAREAHLDRVIRADRISGGGLSLRERAQIDRMQNNLSRDIYYQKHNGRRSF